MIKQIIRTFWSP